MGRHSRLTRWYRRCAALAGAVALLAPMLGYGHYGRSISEFDSRRLLASEGPMKEMGAWYVPPLPPENQRTQAVHSVLLPSGKVLIVNGSSNRNRISMGEVIEGVDVRDPVMVDNTALFDPAALPVEDPTAGKSGADAPTGWIRIGSPPTPYKGQAMDLFCSGHLHLADGNVLFVSGTNNYYPGEKFHGSKGAWIFDWRKEGQRKYPWRPAGMLHDGHWYPTLVPLADGRIAVFSGVSYEPFDNSPWVEFFDPSQPLDKAWLAVNISDPKKFPNGPFTTLVGKGPNAPLDTMFNYPRIYPLQDGRLMITGDGAGGGNVDSRHTYHMKIGPADLAGGPPKVSFGRGPERKGKRKSYSTAVLDPNSHSGDILLIGGMEGSDDINIAPGDPPQNYGIRVTAALERYRAPAKAGDGVGSWDNHDTFLGHQPADHRIMHLGVILPTKEVLLIGGGNYGFHDPVVRPQLLRPDAKAPGGYRTTWMNPGIQPRLYHTTALLLPDGRVLVAGGNSTRAAVNTGSGEVELDVIRKPDKTFTRVAKGRGSVPAEIWQMELFYPPYLFKVTKEEPRPEITKAPESIAYGASIEIEVDHMTDQASLVMIKLGSVTHGWDMGQRLVDLAFTQSTSEGTVTFSAPTNRHMSPPGYYMLFYVNSGDVPSHAAMVRLDKS